MLNRTLIEIATIFRRREGQTLTEYALILVVVALGGLIGVAALASPTAGLFEKVLTTVEGVL